jgi:hypothetical protein
MKQEQVLLRRQPLAFGSLLAEAQEAAKLVTELRQCFKVGLRKYF